MYDFNKIDALGQRLGHEALTTLVRLCPEIREASPERLEAACAAMRAKAGEALDEHCSPTPRTRPGCPPWPSAPRS